MNSTRSPLTALEDEGPVATEFWRLLARLGHRYAQNDLRSILVTSASRGEGKTTTAVYLAASIAQHQGLRTVLVDADMRKPQIHRMLNMPRGRGLGDVLTNSRSLESSLQPTMIPNLTVLTAGSHAINTSKAIESPLVQTVIAELKATFDRVIIDSPPVVPVCDPLILGPLVNGVLLVVMAGRTPREVVHRAKDLLVDVNANLLGVVLNNATETLPYYYDYRYYGYHHSRPVANN
jgi:capsular exopolysaccharide synthesis family protein